MKKVRILGIDPGYAIVGFGVLDYDGIRFTPIEYGAVLTEAGTPFPERLRAIHEDVEFIFNKFAPDCMAIERLYFTTNQKTAIDVAQARGITVLSAAMRNIPVSGACSTPAIIPLIPNKTKIDSGTRMLKYENIYEKNRPMVAPINNDGAKIPPTPPAPNVSEAAMTFIKITAANNVQITTKLS